MGRIEKTVFISYRRRDELSAVAVFEDLTPHGYDVFIDFDGIASGSFETAILENIKARAHFLVVLTPTSLKRSSDPEDWMRREIEAALDSRRNIVPVMFAGFNFGKAAAESRLTDKLAALQRYSGLRVPEGYFAEAMDRLRNKFLSVPVDAVLHPASEPAQRLAKEAAREAAPQRQGSTLALQTKNWREAASTVQSSLDNRAAELSSGGMANNSQVPWTDEQWTLANQVIQEEASRVRVAAKFLRRVGPHSPDAYGAINDTAMKQLATLEVQVSVSGAEMADPEATLRRAANVLARLEDAVVFRGLVPVPATPGGFAPPAGVRGLPAVWQITGGQTAEGLWSQTAPREWFSVSANPSDLRGNALVRAVSEAVGLLEHRHSGPFAVVLVKGCFLSPRPRTKVRL